MATKYKPTIGLEIHAELKTQTKMFCNSKNDPNEERPNVNVCPVCMGHPGTLPVINKEAVKHVLKVGHAIGADIADFTEWDRKNYFYPDIPKGYQISQYKYPLVSGGNLAGVEITRIHLEEDTASSRHDQSDTHSLVDFNRAGVPLMELVTEPVVTGGEQARKFAKELQLLLRYLGAGDANLEKGEMRIEANISVSDTDEFGTKVEVKNLNSFRAVERAIAYEIERQSEVLEDGGEVIQETRGWDENKQQTFSQRAKEGSADYRYFPDPDLPKMKISEIPEFEEKKLKAELPELPWEKRERYEKLGLKEEDVDALLSDVWLSGVMDEISKTDDKEIIKTSANYLLSDLVGFTGGDFSDTKVTAEQMIKMSEMIKSGDLSSRGAKDMLAILHTDGGDPKDVAEKHNLIQKSDEGELKTIIEKIISDNQKAVDEYKAGKEASLQFLIGQGMKETRGSANPQVLKKLFLDILG